MLRSVMKAMSAVLFFVLIFTPMQLYGTGGGFFSSNRAFAETGTFSYSVEATADEVRTGLRVVKGMPLSITARGFWSTGNFSDGDVTPNGYPGTTDGMIPNFNKAALLMRIDGGSGGQDDNYYLVGTSYSAQQAPETGELVFRINDGWLQDNEGTIVVTVSFGANRMDRLPVIFVHGVGGSFLYSGEEEIWPNPTKLLLDRWDQNYLDLLRLQDDGATNYDPSADIRVGGPIDKSGTLGVEQDIYGGLMEFFRDNGYSTLNGKFATFSYDWRRDIQETSSLLRAKIEQVLKHPNNAGVDKVILVAHSMGGLVSRNYIVDYQGANVESLITIATPWLGAPKAFEALQYGWDFGMSQFGIEFLNHHKIRQLAQNWPGVYELLAGKQYFDVYPNGYLNINGERLNFQQTDESLTQAESEYRHNVALWNTAKSFRDKILDGKNYGVKNILVVGEGNDTDAVYTPLGGLDFNKQTVSGDGTVPLHSADFNGDPSPYIGDIYGDYIYYLSGGMSSHTDLPKNKAVHDLLAEFMLKLNVDHTQFMVPVKDTYKGQDLTVTAILTDGIGRSLANKPVIFKLIPDCNCGVIGDWPTRTGTTNNEGQVTFTFENIHSSLTNKMYIQATYLGDAEHPKVQSNFYFNLLTPFINPPSVDPVDDNDQVVTGKAKVNAVITIKAGATIVGEANAGTDGIFSVPIAPQPAETTLSARASDGTGRPGYTSIETTVKVTDKTPPQPAEVVGAVGDTAGKVTGKAEPGAWVSVLKGSEYLNASKTAADGSFMVNIGPQPAGTVLTVVVSDLDGNKSSPVTVIVVDNTPPTVPIVQPISDMDQIVTGTTEANSMVTIKAGDTIIATTQAGANGMFSVNIPLQPKDTKLSITAKDALGNESAPAVLTVVKKLPPFPPLVNGVTERDTVITGYTLPHATVSVKIGDQELGNVQAGADGSYSIPISPQLAGTVLSITAKDSYGLISDPAYVTVDYAGVQLFRGLVAHYDFEENVKDRSGYGNHGVVTENTLSYSEGMIGKAVQFDGFSSSLKIPGNERLNTHETMTLAMWIQPNNGMNMNDTVVASKWGDLEGEWLVKLNNYFWSGQTDLIFYTKSLNEEFRVALPSMWGSSWQHVVVSFDHGNVKIYVNGSLAMEQKASITSIPGDLMDSEDIYIGSNRWGDAKYSGLLDEFRLYNRALSEQEIQALYGLQKNPVNPDTNRDGKVDLLDVVRASKLSPGEMQEIRESYGKVMIP